MDLTVENVRKVTDYCLCSADDSKSENDIIIVNGILMNLAFQRAKIDEYEDDIYDMLKQLPDEFMKESGGGYSFLYACNDKNGNQWTSSHQTMEQLFMLGIAIGVVDYLLPRELWYALPGAVPYLIIK